LKGNNSNSILLFCGSFHRLNGKAIRLRRMAKMKIWIRQIFIKWVSTS